MEFLQTETPCEQNHYNILTAMPCTNAPLMKALSDAKQRMKRNRYCSALIADQMLVAIPNGANWLKAFTLIECQDTNQTISMTRWNAR